jgi:hypothetical protein
MSVTSFARKSGAKARTFPGGSSVSGAAFFSPAWAGAGSKDSRESTRTVKAPKDRISDEK